MPRVTPVLYLLACLAVPVWADFALLRESQPVPVVVEASQPEPVRRAVGDLVADLTRVLGTAPAARASVDVNQPSLVVGQLGAGGVVDRLVEAGLLDVSAIRGQWEAFTLSPVDGRSLGLGELYVVAGSDPRGTIYGVYEVSRRIGVSPWVWWADVPVQPNPAAVLPESPVVVGPPDVRYRGIFINDEDWGLQLWAAKTFDPELGDIGPKTYARVFELLLRLRANTLWPAMHACSRPFNQDGQNAALADAYGIIMGSSHAEPLLRNNVREWTAPHAEYNYLTHAEQVRTYWEDRLKANGGYENIYTLGMRGIHDSGMQGDLDTTGRIRLLERIFADQRALLVHHVAPQVATIPQIFVAYKEVLELYRTGLNVPKDVTIVWPDDNFGYLRDFASAEEVARRDGGFGVYYHISYLGRPMAYLWINTTPPALIWEEMAKSYAYGADQLWIVNVGDLKPAEIGMDFFLHLAWDVDGFAPEDLPGYLRRFAAENLGDPAIGDLLGEFYRLNFDRKPEHLQYHLPRQPWQPSGLSEAEIGTRLAAFADLSARVAVAETLLDPAYRDAFFQLVAYPVHGARLANERYFWTERYRAAASREAAEKAWAAEDALQALTTHFDELGDGKWRHFINLEPADDDWKSMRIAPLELPPRPESLAEAPARHPDPTAVAPRRLTLEPVAHGETPDGHWQVIPGLGRSGEAQTVLPFTGGNWAVGEGPWLDYRVELTTPATLRLELLPTFALVSGQPLRLAVQISDATPVVVEHTRTVGDPVWSQGVLQGFLEVEVPGTLAPGPHRVWVWALDRGVVVDAVRLTPLPAD